MIQSPISLAPPATVLPSTYRPWSPVTVVLAVPSLLTVLVVCEAAAASAAALSAVTPMRWARKPGALLMRLPLTQGTPKRSDIQPSPWSWRPPPWPLPRGVSPKVCTRPSSNTKVAEWMRPRTHDRVQSPTATPDITMPARPGIRCPLAARLSAPINTLNGMGSCTWPPTGTRPTRALNAVERVRVALAGMV